MASVQNQEINLTPAQRRSNRIKLLILWLVPFLLMAIAGVSYYLVLNGKLNIGSKNNGDLIVPAVQVKEIFSGEPDLQSVWDDKWSLVVRVIGHCDEQCKQALHLSRQLHIRLDKEANRVQRVLLLDNAISDASFQDFLEKEHSLIKVHTLEAFRGTANLNAFDQVLQRTVASTKTEPLNGDAPQLAFFVVDPAGFAMMTYHQAHEGNAILQDLKHLLKFSRQR